VKRRRERSGAAESGGPRDAAAGKMERSTGRLLVIATPLGNLGDITARAADSLRACDLVACEDTRRTRALLSHLGLSAPTISCHKFNEASRVTEILSRIASGETVGLVTDAGTPGVSDPGARLVEAAAAAGFRVEAIPGPSAPAAAMSISGFEASGFIFAGYPPAKGNARRRFIAALRAAEEARSAAQPDGGAWPIVLFEAPHRIEACLLDLAAGMGDRRIVAIREMTKLHEEVLRGSAAEVLARIRERPRRGEFTLVVEGSAAPTAARAMTAADLETAYRDLLESGLDRREALKRLARDTGRPRRDLYRELAAGGASPRSGGADPEGNG
jgi:16S rRNA (cytidine1402-2'-O)-methyltransferase